RIRRTMICLGCCNLLMTSKITRNWALKIETIAFFRPENIRLSLSRLEKTPAEKKGLFPYEKGPFFSRANQCQNS
ncbi:MAG: hypothetical protein R6X21_00675, partial [Candidatus Aminicenantes bacterium]